MRRFHQNILYAVLALWALQMLIDERNIHKDEQNNHGRGLDAGEELAEVTSVDRSLVQLSNYELLSGGFCADKEGNGFYGAMFAPVYQVETCAKYCESYNDCVGFDYDEKTIMCYIYFSDGDRPDQVPGSVALTEPEGTSTRGVGEVVRSNERLYMSSCFFKRRTKDDGLVHVDNYVDFGTGYCVDDDGNGYSRLAFYFGSIGTTEDCAKKCDDFPDNQGFTWEALAFLCLCQFNAEDLPYDPSDPASLKKIPGAVTMAGVSKPGSGECEIVSADGEAGYECFVHNNAPTCDEAVLKAGVSGDPIFMGLHGQVFKFEGRSEAWYSNVATSKLQWNVRFKEFETCPKDENMFITGTTITLYHLSNLPFMKPTVAHTISIMVIDEDKFFPGCESEVCLGEGSLQISIDGEMDITSPGDYKLGNDGGRVIAHNTFSACSRKWYDYVVPEIDPSPDENGRLLNQKTPLEFLNDDKGDTLYPKKCTAWMKDRARGADLFSQVGGWSTIHIETPTISFHVEYRQDKDKCNSHNIDAWISEVSPVLLDEDWRGIVGETRDPKFYPNGEEVMSERSYLLSGKDDKDYEVERPFGNKFAARMITSGSSAS